MPLNWGLNVRSKEELEQRSKDVYGETDEKVDLFLSNWKLSTRNIIDSISFLIRSTKHLLPLTTG